MNNFNIKTCFKKSMVVYGGIKYALKSFKENKNGIS